MFECPTSRRAPWIPLQGSNRDLKTIYSLPWTPHPTRYVQEALGSGVYEKSLWIHKGRSAKDGSNEKAPAPRLLLGGPVPEETAPVEGPLGGRGWGVLNDNKQSPVQAILQH